MADLQDTRPGLRTVVMFVAAAVALVALPMLLSRMVDEPDPETFTIEIPVGTAARIDAGGRVDLFDPDLDFKLRDELIIRNLDVVTHEIGPFVIEPGQQISRTFGEATSISGYCSLHAGGINFEISDS